MSHHHHHGHSRHIAAYPADPHHPDSRSVFGSSYKSPYPYYKRDYDVHKKIWDPYVNRPSMAQRIFEVLALLIALAAVPSFLGGVFQIFIAFYGFFLGIFGLFSWTRRHSIIWILLNLVLIAATIVSIILRSQGEADCMPFIDHSFNRNFGAPTAPNGVINGSPADSFFYGRGNSTWCGNRTLTYITNGILLGLLTLALPFAIKVATERRRRFYDYDYVQGAAPGAAAAPTMPTSGHTAVYNRHPMATGATVAPATPVIATPVYAATNTGSMVSPAH